MIYSFDKKSTRRIARTVRRVESMNIGERGARRNFNLIEKYDSLFDLKRVSAKNPVRYDIWFGVKGTFGGAIWLGAAYLTNSDVIGYGGTSDLGGWSEPAHRLDLKQDVATSTYYWTTGDLSGDSSGMDLSTWKNVYLQVNRITRQVLCCADEIFPSGTDNKWDHLLCIPLWHFDVSGTGDELIAVKDFRNAANFSFMA